MKKIEQLKKETGLSWGKLFFILAGVLIVMVILIWGGALAILNTRYQTRFYPGTKICGLDISGKTLDQAEEEIKNKVEQNNDGLEILSAEDRQTFPLEEIGLEINWKEPLEKSYNAGRQVKGFEDLIKQTEALLSGGEIRPIYMIDEERLGLFWDKFADLNKEPDDFSLKYEGDDYFSIIEGQGGEEIDKRYFLSLIFDRVDRLKNEPIELPLRLVGPRVTKDELIAGKLEGLEGLEREVELKFLDKIWSIDREGWELWMSFRSEDDPESELKDFDFMKVDNYNIDYFVADSLAGQAVRQKSFNKILGLSLDREGVGDYLTKVVSKEINIKPINARFLMRGDRLELLEESHEGREVLIEKAYEDLIQAWREERDVVFLETRVVGARVTQDNVDEMGIKELFGSGSSNFSGSPSNRRHNIAVGAEKLNGILIAPGETFSLVEAIGEVNAEAGYLPELVIKENKTIPEYGGGLCQIATTMFRAAMYSGLPVTERQSHSYAVSYYAPQGTDATIYIPNPDLKFENDSKNFLLIQSVVSGNTLSFEFYGTKDGRKVSFVGPEYWDKKSDGSFKAAWSQVVVKGGQENKKTFYSFYDNPEKHHQ